jgi:ectopic P granules protein 5
MIEAPWLSICCLEIEHDCLESRVWYELLRQLNIENGKLSLEAALKKATSTVICPSFPTASLCVFKWGQFIVNTPVNHQLFPLVCQQFFMLYLARVPLSSNEERFYDSYGVADKFYEYNIGLMKKIKRQLTDAEGYYKELSVKEEDSFKSHILDRCSKIMKSFVLWLEETNLNKVSSTRVELPPQYAVDKLLSIFQGNKAHWSEFISLADIRKKQKESANNWLKQCFRYTFYQRSTLSHSSSVRSEYLDDDPCEKIYKRLQSYDLPKPPPSVSKDPPKMSSNIFPLDQLNGKKMLYNDFQSLRLCAK